MNFENHPCFNAGAHRTHGRIHLPVAPRCNLQCKFCNRKFDCVNESRPGVTSGILTPSQAMVYLDEVLRRKKNISVVGIAGPGDPFANPEETMETLRRVRERHPEMMLCVATNGLNVEPYLEELAHLKTSHLTVTVNAVDPPVGAKVYSYVRHNKRTIRAEAGAEILLENQLRAIRKAKALGLIVKVNSIILPGVNDDHIEAVAREMAALKVDILNCVPYYPCKGSAFEHLEEPSKEMVAAIRKTAGKYISQMTHCTRCRADAAGMLGEKNSASMMRLLQACETLADRTKPAAGVNNGRRRVAVASMEGVLVNQHLGEADKLLIYGKQNGCIALMEARETPPRSGGFTRWETLAETLGDCGTLLVSGIGPNPKAVLTAGGLEVLEVEGLIDEAVQAVFEERNLNHMIKRELRACGGGCSGGGGGCG